VEPCAGRCCGSGWECGRVGPCPDCISDTAPPGGCASTSLPGGASCRPLLASMPAAVRCWFRARAGAFAAATQVVWARRVAPRRRRTALPPTRDVPTTSLRSGAAGHAGRPLACRCTRLQRVNPHGTSASDGAPRGNKCACQVTGQAANTRLRAICAATVVHYKVAGVSCLRVLALLPCHSRASDQQQPGGAGSQRRGGTRAQPARYFAAKHRNRRLWRR
jgi:hypothetical protein